MGKIFKGEEVKRLLHDRECPHQNCLNRLNTRCIMLTTEEITDGTRDNIFECDGFIPLEMITPRYYTDYIQ
jgi:hypothetical protein